MINKKIAIFFDCENISSKYVDEIFDELAKIGEITINKAYHNWSNNQSNGWSEKLSQYAIDPIQVFPNISGKNSIDMKLAIDVTNTTHLNNVDIIVLVSSDSDFSALAIDIRAKGIESIGFGEEKTPVSLRRAFNTFFELPQINKKKNPIELLKEAINNTKGDNGFAYVSQVTKYLINKDSSLNAKNYGVQRWSDMLKEESNHFIIIYKDDKRTLLVKTR